MNSVINLYLFDLNKNKCKNIMNIYKKTLPHVHNIKCINKQCTKKSDEDNDVILIRYDNTGFKCIYYCVHCNHNWKIH